MNQDATADVTPEAAIAEARVLVERRRRMRVVLTVMPGLIGLLGGILSWGFTEDYFRDVFGLPKELVLLT